MNPAPEAVADCEPVVHVIPAAWLLIVPAVLLLLVLIAAAYRKARPRGGASRRRAVGRLRGQIDRYHGLDSIIHRWDPRVKTAVLGACLFCVGALGHCPSVLLAVAFSISLVLMTRIPLRVALARIAAMSAFLGWFFVVMPLTVPARPGDSITVFEHLPWLTWNLRGLSVAGLAYGKAAAVVLLTVPLFSTHRFDVTVRSLGRMGLPDRVQQLMLFSHRYLFVLWDEKERMSTAMASRGFGRASSWRTLQGLGNLLGMLIVRSYERTRRVFEAMVSRGYQGRWTTEFAYRAGIRDFAKASAALLVMAAIIVLDRWPVPGP